MIAEALKFIFDKADKSVNLVSTVRKTGPRERVVLLAGEETVETVERPLVQRTSLTLDAVALLTTNFKGDRPSAYVNESGIAVILDNDDRLERVEMEFLLSDQYQAFVKLADGLDQRRLIRSLRTSLAGCIDHANFVQILRQLEFDVNHGSRSDVHHGQESLGRKVEKEVRAKAGEMPEEIVIRLPLYKVPHDVPTIIELKCAVTMDIDNEQISIEATGDSLSRESKRVMTDIIGRLDGMMPEECLVVFGDCDVAALVE